MPFESMNHFASESRSSSPSATPSSSETTRTRNCSDGVPVDIYLAGLLLKDKHLQHLCLTEYGFTAEDLEKHRATDLAERYYTKERVFDGADLVDISVVGGVEPTEPTYLLPCAMAIVDRGLKPPDLFPLSKAAQTYARRWFPLEKWDSDPMYDDVEYGETKWPDNVIPRGVVAHKLRLLSKSYYDKYVEGAREYVKKEGITRDQAPPSLPYITRWRLPKRPGGPEEGRPRA